MKSESGKEYHLALATAALALLGLVVACDDGTRPPAPGSIQVTARTSGVDPDADGYVVTLDGQATRLLAGNGWITLDGVPAGIWQLQLAGVAANCTAEDGVSRKVTVAAGQVAAVTFAISCVARVGNIAVRVSTTGEETPLGGYFIQINGEGQQPIGANDTTTLTVGEGQHVVTLRGLPDNCAPRGGSNARTVTVAFGQTSTAGFDVVCVPTHGVLRITTTTTGPDSDPDGYTARVIFGSSTIIEKAVPVAGSVQVDLPAGRGYQVRLFGVAPNCMVDWEPRGGITRIVDVGGSVSDISFAVTCEPILVNRLPSGTQLAFVRDGQIYRVGADGTGLVRLADGPDDASPAWSPDGKRIAFSRTTGRDMWGGELRAIFVADADGSNIVQRTSTGYNVEPAWSPDGNRIAFTCLDGSGSAEVCVVSADADGSGPISVTTSGGYFTQPAWSPDGRTIAFVSEWLPEYLVSDLYAMNADGSGVRLLASSVGPPSVQYYLQPAWSPDGAKLAVVMCPPNVYKCDTSWLGVMNADGSGLKTLKSTRGFARPTWSPDGRTIAFSTAGIIAWIRADGSERGIIVADGHSPAWRP